MLVISAITTLGDTSCLECKMVYTKDVNDFENHPQQIILLGVRYIRSGWNSDRNVVYYKS